MRLLTWFALWSLLVLIGSSGATARESIAETQAKAEASAAIPTALIDYVDADDDSDGYKDLGAGLPH